MLIKFCSNLIKSITDIDWEFPNYNEKHERDKHNFVLMLQAIKSSLGSKSLSVALGTGDWRYRLSYNIPEVFSAVDFVNVMTYDLHGSWDHKTGINAPLYRGSHDQTNQNVDYCIKFLINKGVPRSKIIVGIPCYGVGFTLNDPRNNGIGAPATEGTARTFSDICSRINAKSLSYHWDDQQKVPYAFSGTEWLGFDDVRSVTEKANYINSLQLGGAMFWSVDSDDHSNKCGHGKFPLISTVAKKIKAQSDSTSERQKLTQFELFLLMSAGNL